MKVTIKVLLVAAVLVLAYMCVRSIMGPIEFEKEQKTRESAIVQRLIDIRKAQIEYKNKYGVHAANFDELTRFLNEDKLPYLVKVGVLTDQQLADGLTEAEAVKKGLIVRDTIWALAKDTLFGKTYNSADMRYVPGTHKEFHMDTATIESSSGYTIKVFEAGVEYVDYMGDQDRQLLINLYDKAKKLDRYPGLRVGSLEEINNYAGNWEQL